MRVREGDVPVVRGVSKGVEDTTKFLRESFLYVRNTQKITDVYHYKPKGTTKKEKFESGHKSG